MHPERVKLDIDNEIDGFERTTLNRLLSSFESIEFEAIEKRKSFLEKKSKNFNPDIDDEACIEEYGYSEKLNHIVFEQKLKQEFLNSTAIWLFHLFERQKKRVLGTDKTDPLKFLLAQDHYDLDSCSDWLTLNKELRFAANTIKHGNKSDAAKKLRLNYPSLVVGGNVVISKGDIQRYLNALREFWVKALDGKVVL